MTQPCPVPEKSTRYRVMVVPGFLNECFASIALPFEDAIPSLNERGFKIDEMVVSGRSSSDANAVYIAETINNLDLGEDEKLVLVGHSKGAVDILHCLAKFPPAARRVAAVVSVAGAINGSPWPPK
jgi:pimeloyl-ACP methyl ester carboxylesterase